MSELEKAEYAYVGYKSCGCPVAAVADMPQFKKDTAKAVKEFIADGYRVERIKLGEGFRMMRCTHEVKP